jgi:O-antigen ligase
MRVGIEKLIQNSKLTLQQSLSRHPEQRLQVAWNCAQVGLLLFSWFPTVALVNVGLSLVWLWKEQYRTMARRPLNWGLAILSGWLIITCCLANDRSAAFLGLANLIPYFLVFATFTTLFQTIGQLRQLAKILIVGSLPVAILGFGQLFLGWSGSKQLEGAIGWAMAPGGNPLGRMSSVFMYANILAAYLQMVFILGLGLWIETFQAWRKSRKKFIGTQLLFWSVLVIGNAIALVLTNSRNVWAIAVLACLGFALYLGWRWIVLGVTAAASTVLWASFGPMFGRQWLRSIVPAFFWARLSDQLYPNRPVAQLRTTQWQFAWTMTRERPWMGWGLRNFTPLYEAKMHLWLGHPHNLLLMLMAETGIPATLVFCSLIGWILARAVLLWGVLSDIAPPDAQYGWHQDRLILFSYLMAFAGCILFNLLDITLFDLRVNALGWILLSAICGVVYQHRGNSIGRHFETAGD